MRTMGDAMSPNKLPAEVVAAGKRILEDLITAELMKAFAGMDPNPVKQIQVEGTPNSDLIEDYLSGGITACEAIYWAMWRAQIRRG